MKKKLIVNIKSHVKVKFSFTLIINAYDIRPTFYQKAKNFIAQLAVFIVFNADI